LAMVGASAALIGIWAYVVVKAFVIDGSSLAELKPAQRNRASARHNQILKSWELDGVIEQQDDMILADSDLWTATTAGIKPQLFNDERRFCFQILAFI
jgi:hypothetical protein